MTGLDGLTGAANRVVFTIGMGFSGVSLALDATLGGVPPAVATLPFGFAAAVVAVGEMGADAPRETADADEEVTSL